MHKVVLPKKVQKELKKLGPKNRYKILIVLADLALDPYAGKKLKGQYRGCYSWRAWPFRIIYEISQNELVVLVLHIGHRQGVYK